ncbi:MAG: uL15m family ribosomal protein [Thermofilum sp.]
MVRREKKSKYYRGSRTCGWGRVAQHRRSGRKGGRGRVGYHKHKWSWAVKYAPDWYGRHGFTQPSNLVAKWVTMNVGELDEKVEELVRQGVAVKVGDEYHVDLLKLGVNKLTGEGRVTRKLVVKTIAATKKAVAKIEQANGRVITSAVEQ